MAEQQDIYNNKINANKFWLTHPPPIFMPSQSMTPIYNLPYRISYNNSHLSSYNNKPAQINSMPYSCISNQNYQDHYIPHSININNTFPPLPINIDEEYILKHLCPVWKTPKDKTNVWIENWLANIKKEIPIQNANSTNVKINTFSNKVKECKILLKNVNSRKQFMIQNISTLTENEWNKACSNILEVKEQIDTILNSLNLDRNLMSELKLKLAKRNKKRIRLKKFKSNLKITILQQNDEIREINRKIVAWQNTLKENILKEKMVNKTKIDANIVLKGVRGKIDDAKNQLSLFDALEKLRKCRLQNCANKRKNPILEESLDKLKILWLQKLTYYNKEEEGLKYMLSKAEAEKHEKREIEIQEKLSLWDQILFGPDFRSHETTFDNLQTFRDIRRYWDKYIVNQNETLTSSSIPIGWIIPSVPCNPDWAKCLNDVNTL